MTRHTGNHSAVWIATGLSLALHALLWVSGQPGLSSSPLNFVALPGLAIAYVLNRSLPEAITVQYDPLPIPGVWWAAVAVNVVVWAAVFWGAIALFKGWRRRTL